MNPEQKEHERVTAETQQAMEALARSKTAKAVGVIALLQPKVSELSRSLDDVVAAWNAFLRGLSEDRPILSAETRKRLLAVQKSRGISARALKGLRGKHDQVGSALEVVRSDIAVYLQKLHAAEIGERGGLLHTLLKGPRGGARKIQKGGTRLG